MNNGKHERRDFLKIISMGTFLALSGWGSQLLASALPSQPAGHSLPDTQPGKSPVVVVTSEHPVLRHDGANRRILREMIGTGLIELTHSSSVRSAIDKLFDPKDIIGFKFDSTNEQLLRTNQPLAEELLRVFVSEGGFAPDQLIFVNVAPDPATVSRPARQAPFGWTDPVDFASGKDQLQIVLEKVTAWVNVPVLRADALIAVSGCVKNMTYGFLRHPARFHDNQCTPYLADIYNLPLIRNKVRFNVVNSLKVLIQSDVLDGPDAVYEHQSLLFSFDPVAADIVGFDIIDRLRAKTNLAPMLEGRDFPAYLIDAARKGIGKYHPDQIDLRPINVP
jgi:hypothetical protein